MWSRYPIWGRHLARQIKTIGLIAITILLLLVCSTPAQAATAKHYTQLKFPPLAEVKLPKYERYMLDNGMVVYLMEDHELPLVGGTALVRTGDRLEPAMKIGLASLTGSVMRTGGTQKHSPEQLNQLLEQRAAAVESGISESSGSASFSALSEDLEMVFGLFTEVIRQPIFAQDKLDLAKTQIRGGIARRNDDPNSIVGREFQKLVYGSTSPYARTVEYQTLDNISRDDLVGFYRQYFHPNNIILGIVGDFDSKQMRSLISQQFGDWQPSRNLSSNRIPPVSEAMGGMFFVNLPQLTQSYVQMGHLGGKFNSPDYASLDVLNRVLNGFSGRLFNTLRSRLGLAYTVYGTWSPRYDYPGVFVAGGQTRSETTVPFISNLRSQISQLQAKPVTPFELGVAKESVLNSFVFNFEDPTQTISRLMRYEYYGYPKDFLFRYQRGVKATTALDIQRVASKYLKPEQLITLVVGNTNAIVPPLTELSPKVTPVDITIAGSKPVVSK